MAAAASLSSEVLGPLADPDGSVRDVVSVTLAAGAHRVELLSYGAHLVGVWWPDSAGRIDNVVASWRDGAGRPDPSAYADPDDHPYLGALVGRCANRIAGARYELDGVEHLLDANEGRHHLHGGSVGFDRRHWGLRTGGERTRVWAELELTSPDGDQGHPGTLVVQVRYELGTDGELRVTMGASADAPTVVNLTTHPYWNLDGWADPMQATLEHHELVVPDADRVVVVDHEGIPTGQLLEVAGTAFDLRRAVRCAELARPAPPDRPGPIDHCLLRPSASRQAIHARLDSRRSGRRVVLRSDQRGLQVYAPAHGAGPMPGGSAICLEPQLPPDAPNRPTFPSPVLRPGERYRHEQRWQLGTIST